MAILRHETPDGGAHFDLLLSDRASVEDDARVVPTWRCEADPFEMQPGERARVRGLEPHRGLYLRLEGTRELDGARGRVHAVHRGWHRVERGVRTLCANSGARVTLRLGTHEIERLDDADQKKAS
jgi:hypothetical protein